MAKVTKQYPQNNSQIIRRLIMGMGKNSNEGEPTKKLPFKKLADVVLNQNKRPSYQEFVSALSPEYRNPKDYNLKRAYELSPTEQLVKYANNPEKNHLMSFYFNEDGIGEFVKSGNHKTVQKELDWYYSDAGKDFRSQYDLDKSGEYYKYIPRK